MDLPHVTLWSKLARIVRPADRETKVKATSKLLNVEYVRAAEPESDGNIDEALADHQDTERWDGHPMIATSKPQSANGSECSVYESLARHQVIELWGCRDLLAFLQEWADRMIVRFELDIPELALRVDALPRSRLGHFRPGHNGFGLKGEIAINSLYVGALAPWEILGILAHELLHAWQHAHGSPSDGNHHNQEYRRKAESLGLVIGRRGVMGYSAKCVFKDLLRQFGIDVPETDIAPRERRAKGSSKNKKWVCSCPINVRCAVALQAQCLWCGDVFTLCEEPSAHARKAELRAG
ncbi:MAG: hypothetical protein HUU22_02245 [Phycisphaerae bacterium]|nr:hypothetical protein [Phycisphaerae bacterium]NUQ44834.1 hypothetical protein [Phycisphaerae bacterium]